MRSRLATGARVAGWSMVILVALLLVLDGLGFVAVLSGAWTEIPRATALGMIVIAVVVFDAPLLLNILAPLRARGASSSSHLRPPSGAASEGPVAGNVRYELDEREYVHGAMLYRGVHRPIGVLRAFGQLLPWGAVTYALLVLIGFLLGTAYRPHMLEPITVAGGVLGLTVLILLWADYYQRPLEAAATFNRNRRQWWPVELSWTADTVFIRTNEARYSYQFDKCRAWKEDGSMILLHSGDRRYWRLPKRAFTADLLAKFRQLLEESVPKVSAYKMVTRQRQ